MNDQDWLNIALAKMHSGQWFGWKKNWTGSHRMSDENIIILDDTKSTPSEAEVNAKIAELKVIQTRILEYGSIGDQLDMLYHDMAADKGDKTGDWFSAVKKVKNDNPKG